MSAQPALQRPGSIADDVLAVRAQAGDARAFSQLYRRHARYIAGVVFRMLGDAGELDDTVQETFVEAYRGLAGLQDPKLLRRWLVTIALRRVQRRLQARRRRIWLGLEVERQAPQISDPAERAQVDELYDALDRIGPKLRMPWMLARVEGQALTEVAEACGISLATAKRRIALAQEHLDRRLSHV
ncbi:MAG: RNA polymerase sigma factor [Polyangiaceae bacterium]|nr:RNA polymerase sigma factor [Polyangiaceae bacterium]